MWDLINSHHQHFNIHKKVSLQLVESEGIVLKGLVARTLWRDWISYVKIHSVCKMCWNKPLRQLSRMQPAILRCSGCSLQTRKLPHSAENKKDLVPDCALNKKVRTYYRWMVLRKGKAELNDYGGHMPVLLSSKSSNFSLCDTAKLWISLLPVPYAAVSTLQGWRNFQMMMLHHTFERKPGDK